MPRKKMDSQVATIGAVKKIVNKEIESLARMISNTFATKEELQAMRNEFIETFATKNDVVNLRNEIFETFATREELNEKFDAVLQSNDRIAKKLDTFLQEQVFTTRRMDRHESMFKKQDKRITSIETRLNIKPA